MKKILIFLYILFSAAIVITLITMTVAEAQTINLQSYHFDKREILALTTNIYHESRGEPKLGRYMVGYVTINRVLSPEFPNTIYKVVVANKQFSWYNERDSLIPDNINVKKWKECYEIAIYILQNIGFDPTFGALYFHTIDVDPSWAKDKEFIIRVGYHLFYK